MPLYKWLVIAFFGGFQLTFAQNCQKKINFVDVLVDFDLCFMAELKITIDNKKVGSLVPVNVYWDDMKNIDRVSKFFVNRHRYKNKLKVVVISNVAKETSMSPLVKGSYYFNLGVEQFKVTEEDFNELMSIAVLYRSLLNSIPWRNNELDQ